MFGSRRYVPCQSVCESIKLIREINMRFVGLVSRVCATLVAGAVAAAVLGGCSGKQETVKLDSNGPGGASVQSSTMEKSTTTGGKAAPSNGGAAAAASGMK
jgi:hypothetical protein